MGSPLSSLVCVDGRCCSCAWAGAANLPVVLDAWLLCISCLQDCDDEVRDAARCCMDDVLPGGSGGSSLRPSQQAEELLMKAAWAHLTARFRGEPALTDHMHAQLSKYSAQAAPQLRSLLAAEVDQTMLSRRVRGPCMPSNASWTTH